MPRNVIFPHYIKSDLSLGPRLPWLAVSVILNSSYSSPWRKVPELTDSAEIKERSWSQWWDAHHTHSYAKVDHSTSSIHITTAHVTTLNAPALGVTTPPTLFSGETGLHYPKILQPLDSFSEELSYLLKALISPLTGENNLFLLSFTFFDTSSNTG